MKRLTLEQKALRVIDWLVSDDLSETCAMKNASNRPITPKEAKMLSDKVSQIYTISHSVIPEHSCFHVHVDWRNSILKLYKKLRRSGYLIPPK